MLDQRLGRPTQQEGLVTHLTWWQYGGGLLEMGKAFACDSCVESSTCNINQQWLSDNMCGAIQSVRPGWEHGCKLKCTCKMLSRMSKQFHTLGALARLLVKVSHAICQDFAQIQEAEMAGSFGLHER